MKRKEKNGKKEREKNRSVSIQTILVLFQLA